MKVAVYGRHYQDDCEVYLDTLLRKLTQKECIIHVFEEYTSQIQSRVNLPESASKVATFQSLDQTYDLFVSIGGDGTILRGVTLIGDLEIPVVGINLGRLGFLATIQKDQIETAIDEIVSGNYKISKRSMLRLEHEDGSAPEPDYALNEIAVSRKNTTSMIQVETYLDDEYLTTYWADGLIVSTPTGSTGYSLSCGGPVLKPDTEAIVLTPIAPHNLNARPLVIPDATRVKLKVYGRENEYLASLDNRVLTYANETVLQISRTAFDIKMVVLTGDSFLSTLSQKLLWGQDKRN